MLRKDIIENFKGTIIQHGKYNDRLYLMKCPSSPDQNLADDLIRLTQKKGYTKIFAKVPEFVSRQFFLAGFIEEARIPKFYSAGESAVFMSFYLDKNRSNEPHVEKLNHNLAIALGKENKKTVSDLNTRYVIRKCSEHDVDAVANLYRQVFASYPFPIQDPDYLLNTMRSNAEYFCIEAENEIAAVCAAEIDRKNLAAEMTDFATSPGWRSKKFAQHLLAFMEREIKKKKIKTAYTIARAMSVAMNITFCKSGYCLAGRLKNNTNIAGSIESMNVWYKSINKDK